MRILTVRQPWAWAIHGGKDVENRTRNIAGTYRGPVAIHASLALDPEGWTHPEMRRAIGRPFGDGRMVAVAAFMAAGLSHLAEKERRR